MQKCCKSRDKCKTCIEIKKKIENHRAAWVECHFNLKFKFDSSVSGLIKAVSYVENNKWRIQVKFETELNKIKIEIHEVNTAYVGNKYSKNLWIMYCKIQDLSRTFMMFHWVKVYYFIIKQFQRLNFVKVLK